MMARKVEIGSEFWDVPTLKENTDLFPEGTSWFLSGRSALKAIIKAIGNKHTVAMPSWCCDSMVKPFLDAGFKIDYYPVYFNHGLVQEIHYDADVLFLMSYFGYTQTAPDLSGYNGIIIRDVTHSLFSMPYSDADYYFGSLRKWCGVWTGGFAWTKNGDELTAGNALDMGYVDLRQKAMDLKRRYIMGNADEHENAVPDKKYLSVFDEAEKILEHDEIAPAACRDIELAQRIDANFIRKQRRANAEVLRSAFPEWLIIPEINNNDCLMFVPVLVPDGKRDELRRYLINNEVYCPVHWPASGERRLDEKEQFIYQNELSLVCDQRYTQDDMYRMVETIKAFMEG